MISSARRRAIRLVSNSINGGYNSWNDAVAAAFSDTVRPMHIRTDGHDSESNVGMPAGHYILESILPGFASINQLDLQRDSELTLVKMWIDELTNFTTPGGTIQVRSGISAYDRSIVSNANFVSNTEDQPPTIDTLILEDMQASIVRMNGSQTISGNAGDNGFDSPGVPGADGLNEDTYNMPGSGVTGGVGGIGGDGGVGGAGYPGNATGGVVLAYNCVLGPVYIHGSAGGNGGQGGSGGDAPGGQGGKGGDAYTPGIPPGNGGNGGNGGTSGNGGNGGAGGNGSPNTNPVASQFVNCLVTQVFDTAPGGDGGPGGVGGEAPGGIGGSPGYNISDTAIGLTGSLGSNGTPGDNGGFGSAGSAGATQSWSATP